MTPLEEMMQVASDLRQVVDDIERLKTRIGGRRYKTDDGEIHLVLGSEGRYKKAWIEAHTTSTVTYPERTVAEHKNAADAHAFALWAAWTADKAALDSAKEKAHSYRQILSAGQTAARVESDLSR